MIARDLMRRNVITVNENDAVDDLMDRLIGEHIHGAPVVDNSGELVGMVTQQDIFFSAMTRGETTAGGGAKEKAKKESLKTKDIMTSPAVSATENTEVVALCRMMYKLRIHRVPIVRQGQVRGLVSSLDICRAIGLGKKVG